MSVYFEILQSVQRQIRAFPDLTGEDGHPDIQDDAIVLRSVPLGEDGRDWWGDEDVPGIIISPARAIVINPDEGDNERDIVPYPVHIQIIDSGVGSRVEPQRMKSWLKWQEELRKYFNQQNLRKEIWTDAGYVSLVTVNDQSALNTTMFALHKRCVFAMTLTVYSQEKRNTQGRV